MRGACNGEDSGLNPHRPILPYGILDQSSRNPRDDAIFPDLDSALRLLGVAGNAQGLAGVISVQSSTRRIISHGTTGGFTKSLIAVVQGSPQGGGGASTILQLTE